MYTVIGLGIGLLTHPYFPRNVEFAFYHLLPKAIPSEQPNITVGAEWYPYSPAGFLLRAGSPTAMVLLGLVPIGIALWQRRWPEWRSLVLGVLNIGAFFYLLFVAAYHLPGGVAALVVAVQPTMVLLLGAALLKERFRPSQAASCALGVLGVALLVITPRAGLDAVGVVAGLAAAACMASGIVLTKRWGRPAGVGVLTFTGWQLTVGGLLLAPVTLAAEGLPGRITVPNIAGFAYLGLVGALFAYAVWFRGIGRLPALAVSILGFASPLAATVLGYVVLGQELSPVQLAGAAAVIAAVALAQSRPKAAGETAPAPSPTRPDHVAAGKGSS